jgi:flagellar biosynthesis protein FliR
MFEAYGINHTEIVLFGLMLIRLSCLFVTMPITGARTVPAPVKILFSLAMALVLFSVLKHRMPHPGTISDESLILLVGREAFIGVFLGFLARMVFIGVEMAGQLIGFALGFNTAELVNPTAGDPMSLLEQFIALLGTLLFLAIDGHHLIIESLYKSFELAPLGIFRLSPSTLASLPAFIQAVFVMAIKLSAPVVVVLLFVNVALGVVARTVPQINVFVMGFHVNIFVGFFVLVGSIPLIMAVMETDFLSLTSRLFKLMKGL